MSFGSKTWEGKEKIVIAIDCGTTQSGVAYSYLYPEGQQTVQRILQWPGQEAHRGEAKIPSVLWYDSSGSAQAFGAEALSTAMRNRAEDKSWTLVEHFKLHLHPVTMRATHNIVVDPLPAGVKLEKVYADFLGYLYRHTAQFFQDRELDGMNLWKRLSGGIEFVLAHPNGWGSFEQDFLRKAAVAGGLVPANQAIQRVHCVTEAEASVHYVMFHADIESRLNVGTNFIVCDAGGSTADTTLYTVSALKPVLELKEKRTSACVQAGAIFVNQSAAHFFTGLFRTLDFEEEDLKSYIQEATESFESESKRSFESADQGEISIRVGDRRFTERAINVRRGIMTIGSAQVEKFFAPWVNQIIASVEKQMQGHKVDYLLLVGGFGDSPYLRKRFRECSSFKNVAITLANNLTAKAVADGAAMWHIQHSVIARATQFAYGIEKGEAYNPADPRHAGRAVKHQVQGDRIYGVWSEIVPKGQVIGNDEERRNVYYQVCDTANPDLSTYRIRLLACLGDDKPYYCSDNSGRLLPSFKEACVIEADVSNMRGALQTVSRARGVAYMLKFEIVILFGKTELEAYIAWKDNNGRDHRGTAKVLPQRFEA
jgi:hypothetical protein